MKFVPFLGDSRIKHRVVYNSRQYCECIYCGEVANSREHIPGKIFLEKPYPDNLLLVPECKKCNNSFSDDELYMWFVIQILKKKYYKSIYNMSEIGEKRFRNNSSIITKVNKDLDTFCINNSLNQKDYIYNFKSKRIERILQKLGVGHSVFELSECYYTRNEEWSTSVIYSFLPVLSIEGLNNFDELIDISNYPLPEIGSRLFEHIYVIPPPIEYKCCKGFVMLDWVDIQERGYKYICAYLGVKIIVKITISDFLYATITFTRDES